MKALHFEPNAVKSLVQMMEDKNLPKEMIESFSQKELKSLVDVAFYHGRNKRSIIGTILSVKETSCKAYNMAYQIGIDHTQVVSFIRTHSPHWLRPRFLDGLQKGLDFAAKLFKVVCSISTRKPGEEGLVRAVLEKDDKDIELLHDMMEEMDEFYGIAMSQPVMTPVRTQKASFCALNALMMTDDVTQEQLESFIKTHWRDNLAKQLIERMYLEKNGISGLHGVSSIACQLEDNEPEATLVVDPQTLGRVFCHLWKVAADEGATITHVEQYIHEHFPQDWKHKLLGELALKGLVGVVEVAGKMCDIQRTDYRFTRGNEFSFQKSVDVQTLGHWMRHSVLSGLVEAEQSIERFQMKVMSLLKQ